MCCISIFSICLILIVGISGQISNFLCFLKPLASIGAYEIVDMILHALKLLAARLIATSVLIMFLF